MALLSESLRLWDISFRWAGYDPDLIHLRLPLEVKDNFRLLMDAILSAELYCETLTLVKRPFDSKADPKYYIRTYLDEVYACIWGHYFNKKLLKWAVITRGDFKEWCENRSIPLPEFWFPKGWNETFEWPEYGTRASWARHVEPEQVGGFSLRFEIPEEARFKFNNLSDSSDVIDTHDVTHLRPNQLTKLLVQRIASNLWKDSANLKINISQMARHEVIQKYCGVEHYEIETIIKWIREVAPVNLKGKRGRPPGKSDGLEE